MNDGGGLFLLLFLLQKQTFFIKQKYIKADAVPENCRSWR